MAGAESIEFSVTDSIQQLTAAEWDALHDGHPALRHAFLAALECSQSVGGSSGWNAQHFVGRMGGKVVAALPLYLKHHSYGEYVFDWAWADAYQQHGLDYYPKWLCGAPFSPLPGMRLLGLDDDCRRAAAHAALQLAEASGLSSLHVLFPRPEEADWLREAGLMIRSGVQFHWLNRGYESFDYFLASLNHDKRKKIRQERRRVAELGLDYEWLDGDSASAEDWAFFMRCYELTYYLHRSTPYLNEDFFGRIAASMPESVRLLIARRGTTRVACAFFMCDAKALYGRYWGCSEALKGLHFELCYYRPIDYCITHGLSRMEGGAQGEHKLSRGLEPVNTHSAHWIADPRFRDAIDRHLAMEGQQMAAYVGELEERRPFRKAEQ